MESDAQPRLELPVAVAGTPPRRWVAIALGLLFAASAVVQQPFMLGAAIVMPLVFFFVGAAVARQRPQPFVLRFFPDRLELHGEGFRRQVSWSAVDGVTENSAGVAIQIGRGQPIWIPREQLPPQAFREALPPELSLTKGPEPAKKRGAGYYVFLWLVLLVVFVALWELLAAR